MPLNIYLPQLGDDLFRLVSLPCHYSPPRCQRHTSSRTTSTGADHADNSGRGSGRRMATIGTTDNDAALSPPLCPFMTDILPASAGADIVLFVNAMINVTRFALSCH